MDAAEDSPMPSSCALFPSCAAAGFVSPMSAMAIGVYSALSVAVLQVRHTMGRGGDPCPPYALPTAVCSDSCGGASYSGWTTASTASSSCGEGQ